MSALDHFAAGGEALADLRDRIMRVPTCDYETGDVVHVSDLGPCRIERVRPSAYAPGQFLLTLLPLATPNSARHERFASEIAP